MRCIINLLANKFGHSSSHPFGNILNRLLIAAELIYPCLVIYQKNDHQQFHLIIYVCISEVNAGIELTVTSQEPLLSQEIFLRN